MSRKLSYLPDLVGVMHEDTPQQAARREADAAYTNELALQLNDAQAKALVRATVYGNLYYAQDVVRIGELRQMQLVDEVGVQTERGRKVACAIDLGVRKTK